jgi:AraC-like DNA-binding protein
VLETQDPEELRARLASLHAVSRIELAQKRYRFDARVNHRALNEVGLSYARYGAPVRVAISDKDCSTQGFGPGGSAEPIIDGRICKIGLRQVRDVYPSLFRNRANFEHLFLSIRPEALNRKLAALLGSPPGRPFKLTGECDQGALAAQYRLLCFVISEIDRSAGGLPRLLWGEFEQALIVAYLCANLNNYTEFLNRSAPAASAWQVERAIGYIEANWERSLTVEALAAATGTSVRSLFLTFRKSRGCSPMAYVRNVRLERAREILSKPTFETSIAAVATRCGFHNQSHFAKRYLARYGELPSATLKRGKGCALEQQM